MPSRWPLVLRTAEPSKLSRGLLLVFAALALDAAAAPARADAQQAAASDSAASDTAASASGASDTAGVTVSGVVFDSLTNTPLARALVQVVERGEHRGAWSAFSDERGAFHISGLPHGLFLIGFLHPELDSLGLGVAPHMLDVATDAPLHSDLAVPSATTVRRLICAGAEHADSTGLMLGFIRDADSGEPLAGATAVVMWSEVVVGKGIRTERREVPIRSNEAGWYALCEAPADGPLAARAELGKDASGTIEVNVPPEGVLHRDFYIPRGGAAVVVSGRDASDAASNGASDAASKAGRKLPVAGSRAALRIRHGSARLSGVVRDAQGEPVGGAQVMVWGSDITGSTRDDGTFTLAKLPAGTQALEVRYVGYAPKRVAVDLASGETRAVTVTLDRRADVLEQVTVFGKVSRRRSDLTGFLHRRQGSVGHFYTREEIGRMQALEFTDIMRRVPGIKLVPTSYLDYTILSSRAVGSMTGGACQPSIYIDGARLIDDTQINGMLHPRDIAAIEVYEGPSEAPQQYSYGDCGSIVIWTGPDVDK